MKYREESVSESTRRSRRMQWASYQRACILYGWAEFPCSAEQACLYVTHLVDRLSYMSDVTYYNAVVCMHVCKGLEPV